MKTIRQGIFNELYFRIPIGVLVAIIILCIGSGLLTWMVLSGKIHEDLIVYGNILTAATASFSGSLIAITKTDTKKLLISFTTGISLIIVLLMSTAILFKGQYQGILTIVIPVLISSFLACVVTSSRYKHKNGTHFKRHYR